MAIDLFSSNNINEIMIQTARLLSRNLGNKCEIILCENKIDDDIFRIVHLENPTAGHAVGDVYVGVSPKELREHEGIYSEVRTSSNGRVVRTCVAGISCSGQTLAALITNLDISEIAFTQNWLCGLTGYTPSQNVVQCEDVGQMMDLIIDQASKTIGKPAAFMNKADKKSFIKYLDDRGVFQIKKSSEKVAKFLSISKFTLYACLEEIRGNKEDGEDAGASIG